MRVTMGMNQSLPYVAQRSVLQCLRRDGGSLYNGNWSVMNTSALLPFLTTALPIMVTIFLAVWMNGKGFDGLQKRLDDTNKRFDEVYRHFDEVNKRFDDVGKRFDKVDARLERIEAKLDNHEGRIVRLEERTSPLAGVR